MPGAVWGCQVTFTLHRFPLFLLLLFLTTPPPLPLLLPGRTYLAGGTAAGKECQVRSGAARRRSHYIESSASFSSSLSPHPPPPPPQPNTSPLHPLPPTFPERRTLLAVLQQVKNSRCGVWLPGDVHTGPDHRGPHLPWRLRHCSKMHAAYSTLRLLFSEYSAHRTLHRQ